MIRANKFNHAPQTPGVYFFKKGKKIIYIGKAANLRARLRSYAHLNDLDPAKRAMVAEATSISWEETVNDIEALLKEVLLIKRHRPKYNVLLRDDKNYSFVGFTKERFPKVFITHQQILNSKHEIRSMKQIQNSKLKKVSDFRFRLPVRSRTEAGISGFSYIGPFTDSVALKKTLHLLRRIFPYCVCKRPHKRSHLRPPTIARGFLQRHRFGGQAGGHICQYAQIGLCFGFCCQLYRNKNQMGNKAPSSVITNVNTLRYKKSITTIRAILSGKRLDITRKLAKEMRAFSSAKRFEEAANARDQLRALERVFAHRLFLQRDAHTEHEKGLRLLQTIAKLPSFPRRVESYDISHHHGKESVGSMAVFEEGMPAKSRYRKFIIRHVAGINDPAMIHEVLARRLRHTEWPLPDFILIDGGKPQLNAALLALKDIAIKIGALAKREEELYLPNKKPVALKTAPPPLLHLLQHLRNEAHRFAISFSSHRFRKQQIV